ncbi:hypothetical protein [Aeromonas jandaei]|uniref:hypothetical protein n=1 Tax=Aeromonas jandaei TaxID=650 RepID=UPI0012EB45CD|nr:hypothetical protein [Aeromonas jandaei]
MLDRVRPHGSGNGVQTTCRWDAHELGKRLFHELKNGVLMKFHPDDREQGKVHWAFLSPDINSIVQLTVDGRLHSFVSRYMVKEKSI